MSGPSSDSALPRLTADLQVAIVHEKFTVHAGSEKVVEALHRMWPDAPIFCSVCDPTTLSPALADADIRPTPWLRHLYRGGDEYAHLLPLLPWAARSHDVGRCDVVVTSHHQFANRVRSTAPIVSYTHSPARWIWDPATRTDEIGGRIGRAGLAAFAATQRRADRTAAQRLRRVVANSSEVADRCERWWGRSASVVAPPVDTTFYTPASDAPVGAGTAHDRGDWFLLAGRLVPYKRPQVAVRAARLAGVRLVVAGDGRAMDACRAEAGADTEFLGAVSDDELRDLYRTTRALVFPGREDFGIVPVEAQACGAPVIALGAGGTLDTVAPGITGVLYPPGDDDAATLAALLRAFDPAAFDSATIVAHAAGFAPSAFERRMDHEVAVALGLVSGGDR